MSSFTFLETILIVFLTAIISPTIARFLNPYWDFKNELIEVIRILNLHSNILNNKFQLPIDEKFVREIYDVQYDIRIKWSMLLAAYYKIPKFMRPLLTKLKLIPSKADMDFILPELVALSNSMIIYPENQQQLAQDDLIDRHKSIPKIKETIKKYI